MLDKTAVQKEIGKSRKVEPEPVEYKETCSIDLAVSVGYGLEGVEIEEELWTATGIEKPFDELDEENKSS